MSKGSVIALVIIVLVIIGGVVLWMNRSTNVPPLELLPSGSQATSTGESATTTEPMRMATTSVSYVGDLLSQSPYASYAYLISTDTLTPQAQQALSGFRVDQKTLSNGSVEYTLHAVNPAYQTQIYDVKPGQQLYFIDRLFNDDTQGQDKNARDDAAVIVDENGYIVGP